jgi:uncharacterized protein (TIGR02246 family)
MRFVVEGLLAGIFLVANCEAQAQSKSDDDAIRALLVTHTEQWNAHDMDAWSAILHDDADWVHWGGGYWRGKAAIVRGHRAIHAAHYKNTMMSPQRIEDLTFLTPETAIAHVRSEMSGDERSPGETFQYRKSIVFTKKSGIWRIRALHNTRIRPGVSPAPMTE